MSIRNRFLLTVGILAGAGLLYLGCRSHSPTEADRSAPQQGTGRPGRIITAATGYTAGWDTWWQNVSGESFPSPCDPSDFNKFPTCSYLRFVRWHNGTAKWRTYVAMDFDTRDLPDNAIITDLTLKLFLEDSFADANHCSDPSALDCSRCADPVACPTSSDGPTKVGLYYDPIDSLGQNGNSASDVLTEQCGAGWTIPKSGVAFGSVGGGFWALHAPDLGMINKAGVTRYALDLEEPQECLYRILTFTSADATQAPTHRPSLEVKYRMEFSHALTGS